MHKTKYPFCLFTIKEDGARVIWEVTNSCNYSCSYCIFSSKRWNTQYDVSTERMKETLLELRNNNVKYLKVTGWEPFVRADLIEILQYASDIWLEIDVSTNASFLNDEKILALKNMNISYIHVSLDWHTKDIQEFVRWKATFEPTIKGIKKLVSHDMHVRVGTVLYSGNEGHIAQIVEYVLSLGVKHIIFSYVEPVGKLRHDEASALLANTDQETMTAILEWLQEKYKDKIRIDFSFVEEPDTTHWWCDRCPGWKEFMFLDHKWQLSACTWIAEYFPQFTSRDTLHKKSFSELINDKPMTAYHAFIEKLASYWIVGCPKRNLWEVREILAIDNFLAKIDRDTLLTKKFTPTHSLYSFTTENIAGYIEDFDCKNKSILTVWWSGDHIFNAYLYGAKDVTWIDKNIFAKYFAELKRVALLHLSYQTFIQFFANTTDKISFSYDTYKILRDDLSIPSKYFWDALYELYQNNWQELRQSAFFDNTYDIIENKISYNPYLHDTVHYQKTQEILKGKSFTRISQGIETYTSDSRYDIILLSNISDYTHLMYWWDDHLQTFKESILAKLSKQLTPWWILQCAYIYDYTESKKDQYRSSIDDPNKRSITFPSDSYKTISFKSALIGKDIYDAIIYYVQ